MVPSPDRPEHNALLPVWFAIGLMFTLFVGTGAGVLGWLSGQTIAAAVLTGVTTFVGLLTVVLMTIEVFRR